MPLGDATTGALVPNVFVAVTVHRYSAHHCRPPSVAVSVEPLVVVLRSGTPAAEHATV
jgi:hypothetical protein